MDGDIETADKFGIGVGLVVAVVLGIAAFWVFVRARSDTQICRKRTKSLQT